MCAATFEVVLATAVARFYELADRPLARKLSRCFTRLEQAPRSGNNVKPLKGEFDGYWRYRVGDWRVVYRVDDDARRVLVVTIAHRRDVYE